MSVVEAPVFRPHLKSPAALRPQEKSFSSVRGSLVDENGREVVYFSTLERDLAAIAMTHPDVEDVQDQPPTVAYRDVDGAHTHTFDFRLRLRSGTSLAIAVKPSWRVASSGLVRTLTLIAAQRPTFADRFEIRTERHICRIAAANARLILQSRRLDLKDAVEEVETIVASMRGACAIEAICAQAAHCGFAFYAIVRLIDVGRLRPVMPGLIEGSTMLEPVGRH